MKKLLTVALVTLTTSAIANCNLSIDKKKAGAKTSYVNGVSVSAKIVDALKAKCTITERIMNESEIKEMKLLAAKKRYEKLLNESKQ